MSLKKNVGGGNQNEGEDNWGRADNRRKSGFVLQVRFYGFGKDTKYFGF